MVADTARKAKVGIFGCGNISGIYLKNCPTFDSLQVVACADIIPSRAEEKASAFGIKALSVDELLRDPEIDVILNLTIPKAHSEINLAALHAGKSVYTEKPLAVSREDGFQAVALARQNNLRLGSAPDTFLGGGLQTCRRLIDDGAIGKPVAATAFMVCHGHEGWHPDPEFYYQVGGGPMFDMGPYYLTALVSLLGPVNRVTGSAQTSFPERTITSQPRHCTKITVEVPTHVVAVLDFASGAVATLITSFDVWHHTLPRIEIYGSEGSLQVPDPNTFNGPVFLRKAADKDWREIPLTHGYAENSRGLGLADMMQAQQSNRPHRASGNLAYHVLDIMQAVHDASRLDRHIVLTSQVDRPAPLPLGLRPGQLDA